LVTWSLPLVKEKGLNKYTVTIVANLIYVNHSCTWKRCKCNIVAYVKITEKALKYYRIIVLANLAFL